MLWVEGDGAGRALWSYGRLSGQNTWAIPQAAGSHSAGPIVSGKPVTQAQFNSEPSSVASGHNWSMDSQMTAEEVRALVHHQSAEHLSAVNDHRITLASALVTPRMIIVIVRQVKKGRLKDENLVVWLVGQENRPDGYKMILRDDGLQFGLASRGFPDDEFPVLAGWYGNLITAFLGM